MTKNPDSIDGKIFVSKLGTNLRLTVEGVDEHVHFVVERRIVDRKTGEIVIEERKRTATPGVWAYVTRAYMPTRKT